MRGLTIIKSLYKLSLMNNLDTAFFALSDPTRRAILGRLALGEATVLELAEPFAMTQPAVSQHIRVLEEAGLILRRIEGTKRPCRLAPKGMSAIEQWVSMLSGALTKNYDRLDQLLANTEPKSGAKAHEQAKPKNRRR